MSEVQTQTQKIALITGASRGIGAAIAERLAQDGYFVVINFSSSEAKAKEVLNKIEAQGGKGILSRFDVSNSTQVNEAFEAIAKTHGPISVLVNNAGVTIDGLARTHER